ncbi:MAG: hypothetical protein QXE38_05560 [Candidatus Methanomethylicia archaeon]
MEDFAELTSQLITNIDGNSAKFYYTSIAIPVEDLHIFWEFKQLVITKYGKIKGAFSRYLIKLMEEEVIRHKTSKQHHAVNQLQTGQTGQRSDIITRLKRIKQCLIEQGIEKEIPEQHFIEIIRSTGIKDIRTIKKYYQLCLKYGCKRVVKAYTVFISVQDFVV